MALALAKVTVRPTTKSSRDALACSTLTEQGIEAMISSPILLAILHAAIIPTIGIWALLATKLMVGNRLRWAERCFMGILLTVSLATLHAVMTDNANVWFVHMLTLALMVLGQFLVPSRHNLHAVSDRPVGGVI
ncbi:MAG: hypothetical protein CBB71_06880 [Rhodopirellula sp. TMED11]|nr:MAG: hypothetical protein CBB71_06880 [Rhodopirellula sp. TMED11]